MDDSIEAKVAAVKSAYPNDTWSRRVDGMSEAQVIALYFRLKEQKKI